MHTVALDDAYGIGDWLEVEDFANDFEFVLNSLISFFAICDMNDSIFVTS